METVIYAVILLGLLGLLAGTFLAFAAKKFEVKENSRKIITEIVLPGINCGACGYPGCSAFAKGFINGEVDKNGCVPGKRQGVPEKLELISKMSDEELNELYESASEEESKIKEELEKKL
ncbi:(Fe-S)-binding protein [Geotoga petraea]|jgi:electron transport complex protein RnfB|uniref:Electron transport complex protein RnfB n=1 Tax=Geotoga petraea TaxID=28234 RepID=A0A1G6JLW2_9BACT|nr:(Fe-S)-binding protein [Geotoga petraea]MDK2945402.1 H+/Na+-translocating ferredoxin:NAD+ oxidoreductase subunit [Geotoga sp.]TGG88259.1 Fe-S protein [Geotoga petraea]SDC19703.1 electron transport complex protein RnfB [Geotoga petraea]